MHRFRRIAGSAVLAAALITGGMAVATPVEVAAASTTEKLIYGAAALLLVSQYYSKLDDQGQAQFYEPVSYTHLDVYKRQGWMRRMSLADVQSKIRFRS